MLLIWCIRALLVVCISGSDESKEMPGSYSEYYFPEVTEDYYNNEISEYYFPDEKATRKILSEDYLWKYTTPEENSISTQGPTTTGPTQRAKVICDTWTTQVLDCSDKPASGPRGLPGQKGERGEAGFNRIGDKGEPGEDGYKGGIGVAGADGKAGMDGSHGYEGPRGDDGDAGPGCDVEELKDMRRKNEIMEEEFEMAKSDTEELESEYEMLRSSHDEIHNLLYEFMGGHPCKVDIGATDHGKVSVSDGTYIHHVEEIRLYCDEGFVPLDADVKTCNNGTITPTFQEAPFVCVRETNDCDDIKKKNASAESGVYTIRPFKNDPETEIEVWCDMDEDGHGWIVLQRRFDGNVNFTRGWDEYTEGFGDINGEYWLGLQPMYELLKNKDYMLKIDLEKFRYIDHDVFEGYAQYETFYLGSEAENFILTIDGYSGTAGDALVVNTSAYDSSATYHMENYHKLHTTAQGMQFSTFDRNNDNYNQRSYGSCAEITKGGWWFNNCSAGKLNGDHLPYYSRMHFGRGIQWFTFNRFEPHKSSMMKIRRKN